MMTESGFARLREPIKSGQYHKKIWTVQYRRDTTDHIVKHINSERAIEAACRLIQDGCDVSGIGTGALTDAIAKEEIARIYAKWSGAKVPAGRPPV